MKTTRRDFIALASSAALAGCASTSVKKADVKFGVCCGGPNPVKDLAEVGYDFWEGGTNAVFNPDKDEKWWKEQCKFIKALPIPIQSCNGLLPKKFRLTGPARDFAPALDYLDIVTARADELGVPFLVFGSGGARNAPEGYDVKKAFNEFVEFNKRLAERIEKRNVTIVLEPLQPKEANFLNFVTQGIQVSELVGSPRIQCLADFFHMVQGGESAQSILLAGDRLKHCHIAEKGTRKYPGFEGCDYFIEYFRNLKAIGYNGGVSCECGWVKGKEALKAARVKALSTMKEMLAKA
jgi:sugar phosphate isomerase/epimerase